MNYDWRDFKAVHGGEGGARSAFETACESLIRETHSLAQAVRPNPGDDGVDIYVGDIGISPIDVYQCKFFLETIGGSQKQQIRQSFHRAITCQDFEVQRWILCIPKVLDVRENIWWTRFRCEMQEQFHVNLELRNGDQLLHDARKFGLIDVWFDRGHADDRRYRVRQVQLSKERLRNITRHVKKSTKMDAYSFFKEECFATSIDNPSGDYILSCLHHASESGTALRPLSDSERSLFVSGRPFNQSPGHQNSLTSRRTVIIGDSGLGKTTLLRRIELEVAGDSSTRIPIYLSGLSDYLEFTTVRDLLGYICARKTGIFPRPSDTSSREAYVDWLDIKVSQGEVIFLLDALDQADQRWRNLNFVVDSLVDCPFFLTVRPDSLRTRALALGALSCWEHIYIRPIKPSEAFRYLGENAPEIFRAVDGYDPVKKGWGFRNKSEYDFEDIGEGDFGFVSVAKDSTEIDANADPDGLLTIPLVIQLLRHAAARQTPFKLGQKLNRYEVYEKCICGVGGLIDEGVKKLRASTKTVWSIFTNREEGVELLSNVALWQVRMQHFENDLGKLRREFVSKLRGEADGAPLRGDVEEAVKQLNLVTSYSLFESETGIAWRHRSFFEFLAGRALGELFCSDVQEGAQIIADARAVRSLERDTLADLQREAVEANNWEEWRWTLRFALSHVSLSGSHPVETLIAELLAAGDPFVVREAMKHDGLDLQEDIATLIRWLVDSNGVDSSRHKVAKAGLDRLGMRRIQYMPSECLSDAFIRRDCRDAQYLFAARELLSSADYKDELGELSSVVRATLGDYLDSSRWVDLMEVGSKIAMADFPVTNEWFETFCPSHRRLRNAYSRADDQPVLQVSWLAAVEFCTWLSSQDKRWVYFLPTQSQWEAASSWNTTTTFWWGDEFDASRCWNRTSAEQERSRSRGEAIVAFDCKEERHPSMVVQNLGYGLLDMLGNVEEWVMTRGDQNASRMVLGGCWSNFNVFCHSRVRSPKYHQRDMNEPSLCTGFRICRRIAR